MGESNKKLSDLMITARDLFWKHGFKRVTVEEICLKANVSKMTFYKHFPNKIELAKAIFDEVVSRGQCQFRDIMESAITPEEKIKKVMLMKLEITNNISPEFLKDFYAEGEPELKEYVEKRTHEAWDILKDDYKKAQANGVFRKDFNMEILIKVQFKLIDLINDESLMSMFKSPQDLIMAFANMLVYGIVPHGNYHEKQI